jgi:hypothetical protein
LDQFKRPGGAGGNTERISLAQLAFIGFQGFRVEKDHPNGAVADTGAAADATILVYANDPLVISVNRLYRADRHAIGILTLVADPGQMIKVLCLILYDQTGKPGVVSLEQVKGADQLADTAPGAFVKMYMDKGFDGRLLETILRLWHINITY